jgi:hypothetical protein
MGFLFQRYLALGGLLSSYSVQAWTPAVIRISTTRLSADRGSSGWGTADNWDALSRTNKPSVTSEMLETDYLAIQAMIMENFGMNDEEQQLESEDDQWIRETIENFAVDSDVLDHTLPSLLSSQEKTTIQQEERESTEITRLIRCNESPQSLLLAAGRAIPQLTEDQRTDIRQLLNPEPTIFLEQSVRTMFLRHARPIINGEIVRVMEGAQIAHWMEVCLQGETVSAFDSRVRSVLGKFGQSGAIYEDGFQRLYADAARTNPDAVWRDLRAHEIVSPAELGHSIQLQELASTLPDPVTLSSTVSLDECALLEDGMEVEESSTDRHGKGSHEKVELVPNTKVPLWIKDGEFGMFDGLYWKIIDFSNLVPFLKYLLTKSLALVVRR